MFLTQFGVWILLVALRFDLSSGQDSRPYFTTDATGTTKQTFPATVTFKETAAETPGGTPLYTFYAVDDEGTVPFLNFTYDVATTFDTMEKIESTSGSTTRVAVFKLKQYEAFDYETQATYHIYVQAFDGVNYSYMVLLTIQILDVYEAPTMSPNTPVQYFTVAENAAGTVIGSPSFKIVDGDASEVHTWSITGGNGTNFIAINSNNGTITFNRDYDRDNSSYAELVYLDIKVTDKNLQSFTTTYSVTITDRNDNTPKCSPKIYTFNITSASSVGDVLASINCTDADITSPNNQLTFGFQTTDANSEYFSVNGTDLTLKYHIDLEWGTGPYTVYLLAKDGGSPSLTGTATLSFSLPEATTLPPTTTNVPNPAYDALSSDNSLTALLIVAAFGAACILGYVLILCWRWHTFGKCLPDHCPGRDDFRKCCTCCPGDDIERDEILSNSVFNFPDKKGMSLGPEAPNSRRKTPSSHFP